jgi:site-specific DNA-adenine methylase
MKNYNQAPLPFQGQKRKFLKEFQTVLKQHFNDATVFVDLFGGSGFLSNAVKQIFPEARVIYNDFDDYHLRLANIPRTNALLADLRPLVANTPREKKIDEQTKADILARIYNEQKSGFVDYITLSSSLLFSAKYATSFEQLSKETMYNNMKQSDYNADDYLTGVEIVKQDYAELFRFWRDHPSVVFLVDPPYLSTDCSTYGSDNYWRLSNYLDVLQTVTGTSYFYFTSNKSSIIDLCECMERYYGANNPFAGATRKEIATSVNFQGKYIDIMLYKHK